MTKDLFNSKLNVFNMSLKNHEQYLLVDEQIISEYLVTCQDRA